MCVNIFLFFFFNSKHWHFTCISVFQLALGIADASESKKGGRDQNAIRNTLENLNGATDNDIERNIKAFMFNSSNRNWILCLMPLRTSHNSDARRISLFSSVCTQTKEPENISMSLILSPTGERFCLWFTFECFRHTYKHHIQKIHTKRLHENERESERFLLFFCDMHSCNFRVGRAASRGETE